MIRDIGIDLGTANSLVFLRGKGVVLSEPSVVAINNDTGEILAVGSEAKKMIGRTPGNILAIRPMKDGVIADFDTTESMLKYFIQRAMGGRSMIFKPRIVICVPAGVTSVEERAVKQAALQAGAKEAHMIEEPMVAAVGAGLPIHEPTGNMIVDIGGGTTDVAVISLGGIVTSRSIRVGGDEMDEAIANYIKRNYNLMIGERTSEDIKINIGTAYNAQDDVDYEVRGRDLVTGLPKNIIVTAVQINEALQDPVQNILEAIKICLEKTPPELSADIMDRGIMMAGGGALLTGMNDLISNETGMPVHIAEDPLTCVAKGTGNILENIDLLKRISLGKKRLG